MNCQHNKTIASQINWIGLVTFSFPLTMLVYLTFLSTNLEYRARERQKKRKRDRPAKLNKKKGDGDLEREIKNKGEIFLLEEQHENFVAAVTK